MAFLSPTPSIMSGLDPRAQQLIQDARNMGLGEDEIAQMLDSSGFNPMEYANDLYAPSTPLPSKEPSSTIPPQVAQTLAAQPGMEPTFAPPQPDTPNNVRVGKGDQSYGDYNDPNVFTQRWNDAADAYGVPRDIAQGLLTTENAPRDPFATNDSSSAIGLGQLTDAAQADYNKAHGTNFSREDFFDPDLNTDATFWYWTTRDGDTPLDKTRAYYAGNKGAARGEGGDYAALVAKNAGQPGSFGRGPATGMDGTSTLAAPPAYNDMPTEAIPPTAPGMRGDILGAEPGGEAVDTTSESPGFMDSLGTTLLGEKDKPSFFGKLMGALSGPMGEGLMGMGAGILGARGTYGNTFQAIGQGGEKGLEAYGYAQRRAQRDKEAAAQAKLEQQKLLSEADTRKSTRLNMQGQLLASLMAKNPKAAEAYVKAHPEMMAEFGGNVDGIFGNGDWDIQTPGDGSIYAWNKTAGTLKELRSPTNKDGNAKEITLKNEETGQDEVWAAHPRTLRPMYRIGLAQGKDQQPKETTMIDRDTQEEVRARIMPDGSVEPILDKKGRPILVPGTAGESIEVGKDGSVTVTKGKKGDGPTSNERAKAREQIEMFQRTEDVGRTLLGSEDPKARGNWGGGILTQENIGIVAQARSMAIGVAAQAKGAVGLLAQDLKDTADQLSQRGYSADGPSEDKRFNKARWFPADGIDPRTKKALSLTELYTRTLAAFQSMNKNPDGRISDADMKLAMDDLDVGGWWQDAGMTRAKIAGMMETSRKNAAIASLKVDGYENMPPLLREYIDRMPPEMLQPTYRQQMEAVRAKEAAAAGGAPPEAAAPDAQPTPTPQGTPSASGKVKMTRERADQPGVFQNLLVPADQAEKYAKDGWVAK